MRWLTTRCSATPTDRRATLVFVHGAQTTSVNGFLNPFAPTPVTEVGNETFKAAADLVTRG